MVDKKVLTCPEGAIEKGANDGQRDYANDLMKALRAGVTSRPRANTSGSKIKKVRKRKSEGDALKLSSEGSSTKNKTSDWGFFEPLHGVLGPVVDICSPLFSAQSLVGLLLFLLIISWFRNSRLRNNTQNHNSYPGSAFSTPRRLAAYEEIWRGEESALWDWLEERIGMAEGFTFPVGADKGRGHQGGQRKATQESLPKVKKNKKDINDDISSMDQREVEWAIDITEKRLGFLKEAIGKTAPVQTGFKQTPANDGEEEEDDYEISLEQIAELEELIKAEL